MTKNTRGAVRTPMQESFIDIISRRQPRISRDTIFVLVADENGKFGAFRQNTREREWGVIQGRIETKDRNAEAAALRELEEEIGLQQESFTIMHPQMYRGRLAGSRDPAYTHGFYIGHLVQIVPNTHIRLSEEIREYRFGTVDEVCRLLIEQPGIASRAKSERLERIREKGRNIFCPALHLAASILDDYTLLKQI